MTDDTSRYVLGDTYTRQEAATFEFKDGSPDHTGGGYPRWRSVEHGPHTPGDTGAEVYVPVHRLLAVVACYPADEPLPAILNDLAERDVHHQLEMPSANLPDHLEVLDHGTHSSVTRTQQLAWAKDAKRERQRRRDPDYVEPDDRCQRCGDESDAAVAGSRYCMDCALAVADELGETVEL